MEEEKLSTQKNNASYTVNVIVELYRRRRAIRTYLRQTDRKQGSVRYSR